MKELLQKLLEAEILSDETKSELETAFQTQLDEALTVAKETAAADVRAELTEQWITERDTLVEAVDTKVTDFLAEEIAELKTDIESFRDLEAEYAEKIVEEKASMANELQSDLGDLVEKIDSFLEIRLASEMDELREDLEEQRKNVFGRKIMEAFAEEFADNFFDAEAAGESLQEAQAALVASEEALVESETALAAMERKEKMKEILSPLSGRQEEVMEAILKNVDTEQLEEGYQTFIGRVLKEAEEADSEKEDKVLADKDSDDSDEKDDEKDKKNSDKEDSDKKEDDKEEDEVSEGVIVNGDTEEIIVESVSGASASDLAELRKLAGI